MAFSKKISLHPKLAAAAELIFGLIFFWLLKRVTNLSGLAILLLARLALSSVLAYGFAYFPPSINPWQHVLVLAVFEAGLLPLVLFTDWSVAWHLLAVVSVLSPSFLYWLIPPGSRELSFELKPYRRIGLLMTVMAVAGIWSGLLALFVFQLVPWFNWWLPAVATILPTLLSGFWWRRYEVPLTRRALLFLGLSAILLWEASLVVLFSSIGNFAGSLMLTWWWYVLWLMGRFYLSPGGLNFKKQLPFVIINGLLLVIYILFVVRWK